MFKPGVSGNPAGKPKGSKNKVAYDVAKILSEIKYVDRVTGKTKTGFDPFIELGILGATAKSEKVRADACAELCNYVAPKLKHIEHASDGDLPLMITLNMAPRI